MAEQKQKIEPNKPTGIKNFFSLLGPGLVTGAADDDPAGIVTYSQSGAKFGFGQLWTMLFILPLMIAVQEIAARIGIVTGKGIASNIKEHYSRKALVFIAVLLLAANTVNLGADLGAMAEAARLIVDLPFVFYLLLFVVITIALQFSVRYAQYSKFLKWLTLALFAYVISGIIVSTQWTEIIKATIVPHMEYSFDFLLLIVGLLGTTISPYLIFWQASQEIEEKEQKYAPSYKMSKVSDTYLKHMRVDTFLGMFFSQATAWFIIVTTAGVLHQNGVTDIQSAAQAARAIEPFANNFAHAGAIAEILFALGIIGTGLLAVPIFSGSSSYAVAEMFNWQEGLSKRVSKAKGFYLTILLSTAVGLLMNLLRINPIKALIYSAVINGIVAVPVIFWLLKMGNDKKVMGEHTSGALSNFFVGATFLLMLLAGLLTIYSAFS